MATHPDPFALGPTPDREQLERYVRGELGPEEAHAVELHLEADPLLREAVEGLAMAGALDALNELDREAPRNNTGRYRNSWPIWIGAGIVAIVVAFLWFNMGKATPPANSGSPPVAPYPSAVESTMTVVQAELDALPVEPARIPEPLPLDEKFAELVTVERDATDRMEPLPTGPEAVASGAAPRKLQMPKASRQLLFLHGLKVVHPSELGFGMRQELPSPGRPAASDTRLRDSIPTGTSTLPYLEVMDQAMGNFSRNDYREALIDLYLLLDAHPDDVNAQFYAGLASYRLGLYPRAGKLLERAATNPIDSFNEEARWYLAQATLAAEGPAEAVPLLERIVAGQGFYAEQANTALRRIKDR